MSVRSARCPGAGSPGGGLYRPRSPRTRPLWQCAKRHAGELRASGRMRRAVEQQVKQVIERFIACGDPHEGFARIWCDPCRHEFLLAYACKTRYFCPSCHQKRVLPYGEWVEQNVLAPETGEGPCLPSWRTVSTSSHCPSSCARSSHRQRAWRGELCRIAARLLTDAYTAAAPCARPGLVLFAQTFGDLTYIKAHLHVLAADGVFGADGTFIARPPVPEALTCRRHSARSASRSWRRSGRLRTRCARRCSAGATAAGFLRTTRCALGPRTGMAA